jgi:NADH-quinone oxidoreductase subunit N
MNFLSLIELKNFNVFPEYFLGISALYILVIIVLVSYNIYGLIIQKALSESIGLILLLTCYIILNDDIGYSKDGFEMYSTFGFYKTFITDYLAFFTKFIICFFSSIYFFMIADFLKDYKLTFFEYLLILLLAVLGLMLLCSSNDLLTGYLSIELVSLSSYILSAWKKTSNYSAEAGLKYLVTGAISSAFFLFGSSFIYAYTGTLSIVDFFVILSNEGWFNLVEANKIFEPFLEIGLVFVMFSLSIKLALAPFHVWSLDVYEGSPTISTFFFAVITKLSFFVFLIRISYIAAFKYYDIWQFYLIIVALLSVFIGSFAGLRQRKLKTLLAYSSVSHMGYTLLAFSASSMFGVEAVLFYLIIYMISGLGMWFTILATQINRKRYTDKHSKELGDLVLLRKSNSALAFSLTLTMFSIAGIPPLVGFFAKIEVFMAILQSKYYFLALLVILCSIVSTFYYIRIVKILYFETSNVGQLYNPLKSSKTTLFSVFIFLLLFLFLNPTILYLMIYKVVLCSFVV